MTSDQDLVEQGNTSEEKLRNAELFVIHYQRLAEMHNDPSSTISHSELKRRMVERYGPKVDFTWNR